MARKHDWIKKGKRRFIEPLVKHQISDTEIHLLICYMLYKGKPVTQKTVTDEIRDILREYGKNWFKTSAKRKKHESHTNTAIYIFKQLFIFTPGTLKGTK